MSLTAIIESGSTKSDWVILNAKGEEQFRVQTSGLNPLVLSLEAMQSSLRQETALTNIASQIKAIYFYGAGCSTKSSKDILNNVFKTIFSYAKVEVKTDMQAACYAAYKDKPCLVGILGTGSNSCFFNGKEVIKKTPSLGYVLGDEGAGNHIGRLILIAYHNFSMPQELRLKFQQKFNVSVEDLLKNIYKGTAPNAYLATFSTFAFENKEHVFIKDLILQSFDAFLVNQILPYTESQYSEINFIGSIAYHYQEFLKEAVEHRGLSFGQVIQRPVDNLVSFHKKIGLPQ